MTTYRVSRGGLTKAGWKVVPVLSDEKPPPVVIRFFETEKAAQAEADRLNASPKNTGGRT